MHSKIITDTGGLSVAASTEVVMSLIFTTHCFRDNFLSLVVAFDDLFDNPF